MTSIKPRRNLGHKNWLPEQNTALKIGSRVAVIGAGIAGATVAAELAQAGLLVSVFESASTPATAASGNIAGNCLPVVDRGNTPYSQWYWQAWQQAHHWWQMQDNRTACGDLSGAFKWSDNIHKQTTWQRWVDELAKPAVAQWQNPLLTTPEQWGVFFKQGGYLIPNRVINTLLDHHNIVVNTNTSVTALQQQDHGWNLLFSHANTAYFDALVVTTGAQTAQLLPEWAPFLQLNKGQVTHLSIDDWQTPPQFVLSYGGYAIPAVNGITCVGATFEGNSALELTDSGHAHNLTLLKQALPNALLDDIKPIGGHTAYRAMTIDHLPLVGQAVSVAQYQERIYPYILHPDTCPDLSELLAPNLWLSLGQGARGLTSSFLSASLLRAQMMATTLPVSTKLVQAVHPARIIFRQLVQNALR